MALPLDRAEVEALAERRRGAREAATSRPAQRWRPIDAWPDTEHVWLRPGQVATVLDVSEQAVTGRLRRGSLPGVSTAGSGGFEEISSSSWLVPARRRGAAGPELLQNARYRLELPRGSGHARDHRPGHVRQPPRVLTRGGDQHTRRLRDPSVPRRISQ